MDLLWDVMLEPEPEPEPGEMEVARDAPRLIPSRVVIDFLRTILFLIFNTKNNLGLKFRKTDKNK